MTLAATARAVLVLDFVLERTGVEGIVKRDEEDEWDWDWNWNLGVAEGRVVVVVGEWRRRKGGCWCLHAVGKMLQEVAGGSGRDGYMCRLG